MASRKRLDRITDFVKEKRGEDVALADVVALAEITASSLQAFFSTVDTVVYRELREIADYIAAMRAEISALQFHELKETRIPAAGQELDAIVKATEQATNAIMSCAEAVMATDASDVEQFKALVDAKMLDIFEACSFQDITGQRIAKVVETLEHIETRVARLTALVVAEDIPGPLTDAERASAERKQRLILHGPQLDGEGVDQSEVDLMFR